MLSRFVTRPSYLRYLTRFSPNPLLSSPIPHLPQSPNPKTRFLREPFRTLSSNRKNNNGGEDSSRDPSTSKSWSFSPGNESGEEDSIFGSEEGSISGIVDADEDVGEAEKHVGEAKTPVIGSDGDDDDLWSKGGSEKGDDIFEEIDKQFGSKKGGGDDEWETAEGYKPWSFGDEEEKDVFEIGKGVEGIVSDGNEGMETAKEIEKEDRESLEEVEKEEQEMLATLKGPNRAFGDLITASGITESMLDSLILLKDLEGVEGLPPLTEIEDIRLAKNEMKSSRAEIERQKQEEIAKARVRQVDEKGRAYGTGRRKCSIARVWVQPGDGKFIVNDKQFDVYFPILDHRADLLRPFAETKTLGLWDVSCTVKGGGVSGQVGAIRLGISRALQNWEPGLRPYLRAEGLLTRDSRVVERKKPGKAKARKSFQWVKR